MARSAATIEAEIEALHAAIATGVLKVKHGETETMYQSTEGMLKALSILKAELAGVQTTPTKQVRFQTSKGF